MTECCNKGTVLWIISAAYFLFERSEDTFSLGTVVLPFSRFLSFTFEIIRIRESVCVCVCSLLILTFVWVSVRVDSISSGEATMQYQAKRQLYTEQKMGLI